MGGVYAPCLEKSTLLVNTHVDGWRWEHVRDLNAPAWRKWVNRYSAGNILEAAANFLASATGWALHKQTWVDHDATRLQGGDLKVRPLAVGNVMSRLADYHAIARTTIVADDT
jgi:DNA-binding transcriptional LysR family regulator